MWLAKAKAKNREELTSASPPARSANLWIFARIAAGKNLVFFELANMIVTFPIR